MHGLKRLFTLTVDSYNTAHVCATKIQACFSCNKISKEPRALKTGSFYAAVWQCFLLFVFLLLQKLLRRKGKEEILHIITYIYIYSSLLV